MLLADHDSHRGAGAYPSMTTLAQECGLRNRETASRVVSRLTEAGLIQTAAPSKGGRGKTTIYRFNFSLKNCDPRIKETVTTESQINSETVTLTPRNCDSGVTETVTLEPETVTPQSHEGVEGLKKREGRGEVEPTNNLLSEERAEQLTELVIKTASNLARSVSFTSKQADSIRKTIDKKQPTEEALGVVIREIVSANDPKYVGSSLATELGARLSGYSDRVQQAKREAEDEARHRAMPDDMFSTNREAEYVGDPKAI
jgi:hypothetical protein